MKLIKLSPKDIFIFLTIIILSIAAIIFVNNDYFLYHDPLIKITKITTTKTNIVSNSLNLKEQHYNQVITGTLLNTQKKGTVQIVTNETTTSNVTTLKYRKGEVVFIKDNKVTGLKRDTYIIYILIIFIFSLYIVGKAKGLLAFISVVFNTTIFCIGLTLYYQGLNLTILCIIESIIFTLFSLISNNGFNKKTKYAIISVFACMFILYLLTLLIIILTGYKGVNFNGLSYITVPAEDVFTAELLIGGLGAIMDVCITMSASINELINKDKNITSKTLIKSTKEVGKDIMTTMINVLLFTYLCSGLPLFVLAIRNGFTVYNYIITNLSLELTRFLVGSIGIVISIPISLYLIIALCKKEGVIHE